MNEADRLPPWYEYYRWARDQLATNITGLYRCEQVTPNQLVMTILWMQYTFDAAAMRALNA